ncbi:hypothetical protein JOC33_002054 [Thalassobacillus pellis]|nr:hypothetical protein [Thalassobacillus pellis]
MFLLLNLKKYNYLLRLHKITHYQKIVSIYFRHSSFESELA